MNWKSTESAMRSSHSNTRCQTRKWKCKQTQAQRLKGWWGEGQVKQKLKPLGEINTDKWSVRERNLQCGSVTRLASSGCNEQEQHFHEISDHFCLLTSQVTVRTIRFSVHMPRLGARRKCWALGNNKYDIVRGNRPQKSSLRSYCPVQRC